MVMQAYETCDAGFRHLLGNTLSYLEHFLVTLCVTRLKDNFRRLIDNVKKPGYFICNCRAIETKTRKTIIS